MEATESCHLPLELIYYIVDIVVHCEEPHIPSIQALSLVCRAFVPQCQKALFTTLDIFPDAKRPRGDKFPNKQTRNLHEVLQHNPHLAAHFTTLRWGVSEESATPASGFLITLACIQEHTKIQTLQLYPRCSVHQSAVTFRDTNLLYRSITPFITRLEISDMRIIHSYYLFATCKSLKELLIEKVMDTESTFFGQARAINISIGFRPRIRSYEHSVIQPLFKAAKFVDFSGLRILKVHLSDTSGGAEHLQFLLNACATTIQELHLTKMDRLSCRLPPFLDFGYFPSLQVITLPVDERDHKGGDSFRDLADALATIPKENKVRVLNVDVVVSEPDASFHWTTWIPHILRISTGKPLRLHVHVTYDLPKTGGIVSGDKVPYEEYRFCCKPAFDNLASSFARLVFESFPLHIAHGLTYSITDRKHQ